MRHCKRQQSVDLQNCFCELQRVPLIGCLQALKAPDLTCRCFWPGSCLEPDWKGIPFCRPAGVGDYTNSCWLPPQGKAACPSPFLFPVPVPLRIGAGSGDHFPGFGRFCAAGPTFRFRAKAPTGVRLLSSDRDRTPIFPAGGCNYCPAVWSGNSLAGGKICRGAIIGMRRCSHSSSASA